MIIFNRFRNFESLHKALREEPEYFRLGLRLPPKRITLLYTHTTEFVEQRRVALDKYLQVKHKYTYAKYIIKAILYKS